MRDEHQSIWQVVAVVLGAAAVPCAVLTVQVGTLLGAASACALLAALVTSSMDASESPAPRTDRGRRALTAALVGGLGAIATVGFYVALGLAGLGVAVLILLSKPSVLRRLAV